MKIDEKRTIHQVTIEIPQPIDPVYVKEALAALLYYNGKLTEKEARTMLGKSRRQFQDEVIPKFGLSMIGGTEEDIEIEKQACRKSL